MRIRWKLLILLLVISIVPILLLRVNGQHTMTRLSIDLAEKSGNALIESSKTSLLRLVEDHARVLIRDRQLLETSLEIEALRLEKLLYGVTLAHTAAGPDATPVEMKTLSAKADSYCRIAPERMECLPLPVSFEKMELLVPPDPDPDSSHVDRAMEALLPSFQKLMARYPRMIRWLGAAMDGGTVAFFPAIEDGATPRAGQRRWPGMGRGMGLGLGRMGRMMGNAPPGQEACETGEAPGQGPGAGPGQGCLPGELTFDWIEEARHAQGPVWSRPHVDPLTGTIVLSVAAPVNDPAGRFAGATAMVAPIEAFLHENEHIRRLSNRVTSLLVRVEDDPETKSRRPLIVASENSLEMREGGWSPALKMEWLSSPYAGELKAMIQDMESGGSGVRDMPYQGVESLWAYGPVGSHGTSLMLILPKADLLAQAVSVENYVREKVKEQITFTGLVLAGVVAVLMILTTLIARRLTRPVISMARAVDRVAQGDFTARVEVKSSDEIGELGRALNHMVPALAERIEIKEALNVAEQVQRNLLPREAPRVPGLDVAGRSIYCDQTGGDFFDFTNQCDMREGCLGALVGDVSGHGIQAALLMASAKAYLRARAVQPGSLGQVVTDVNSLVSADTYETAQFLTLFMVNADGLNRTLSWVRAGHEPALLYDPAEDKVKELAGPGALIGLGPDSEYQTQSMTGVALGSVLLMGTDGIWEARNMEGEMFGKDRFIQVLTDNREGNSAEILEAVVGELDDFRGERALEDDVTLVVIRFVGFEG